MSALTSSWTPRILSLLRIVTGYLLLTHGTAKILGFPKVDMFANLQISSIYGIAGILELVLGVLLVIGLFSRFRPLSLRACALSPTLLATPAAAPSQPLSSMAVRRQFCSALPSCTWPLPAQAHGVLTQAAAKPDALTNPLSPAPIRAGAGDHHDNAHLLHLAWWRTLALDA